MVVLAVGAAHTQLCWEEIFSCSSQGGSSLGSQSKQRTSSLFTGTPIHRLNRCFRNHPMSYKRTGSLCPPHCPCLLSAPGIFLEIIELSESEIAGEQLVLGSNSSKPFPKALQC